MIYLSGGLRTDWQDRIFAALRGTQAVIADPRTHGLTEPDEYTLWDTLAIRSCDIVFAYLERSNPSGHGLMVEIGYAKGLGKKVIFVNEQWENRYTHMAEQMADIVFDNLEEALACLKRLYGVG